MSLEDRLYPSLGAFNLLPQWTQSMLGGVYRRFPATWRLGIRYAEFSRLAADGEEWSGERLREYQLKQLRIVLHHAANFCPFYQKSFARAGFRPESLRTLEDLAECPLLDRSTVLERRDEFASSTISARERLYMTTGGSTGIPVGFYLQKGISRPKEQAFLERMWQRAGYKPGMRIAVIRGHTTTSRQDGRISRYDATRNWMLFSSSHLTTDRLPEYLEQMEKFRPEMLHAYPSSALQLAEYLENTGQSSRLSLGGLLCGSERLTLPQKTAPGTSLSVSSVPLVWTFGTGGSGGGGQAIRAVLFLPPIRVCGVRDSGCRRVM